MSKKIVDRLRDPWEDRGWQQMRVLLDQEMPRRKKGVIWWPWIGVAASLGAFVLWLQFTPFSSTTTSNSKQELTSTDRGLEQEIADREENVEALTDHSGATALSGSGKSSPQVEMSAKLTDEMPGKNDVRTPAGKADRERIHEETFYVKEHMSVNQILIPDRGAKAEESILSEISEKKAEIATIGDRTMAKEIGNFNPLTGKDPYLSYIYPVDPIRQSVYLFDEPKIEREKRQLFDAALNVGLFTENTFSAVSFDLGSTLRYKPTRQIAVGVGAYYWSVQANQSFTSSVNQPSTSLDDNKNFTVSVADQEQFLPDSLNAPGQGTTNYFASINQLSYLRLPVFIQLFPGKIWQPYLGLNQMVLLSEGQGGLLSSRASNDQFIGNQSSRRIDDLVRRSNTSFLIGLAWQPARHLSLDFSVSSAGKSYLNYEVSEGEYAEYHNFWRIAFAYRF